MKAILTKYLGPTDFRGSRIVAHDDDGNRVTVTYRHELNSEENHRAAADALCAKMEWTGEMVGGCTRHGYAFVFTGKENGDEMQA